VHLSLCIEIVATRCQILRLKCTKIDFGAPQTSYDWNKGDLLLKVGEGCWEGKEEVEGNAGEETMEKRREERRRRKARRGKGRRGEWRGKGVEGTPVPIFKFSLE